MQTDARVGVEGGKRALNSSHGGVIVAADGGGGAAARKSSQHKPLPMQKAQVGVLSQMIAGGVAGAFGKTCTAPFSRLTILLQVQGMHTDVATVRKTSLWHEASRIVTEEGFRAFWRGNLVTIIHRLPYSSVNFASYEHYKKLLHMVPGLESHRQSISADICVHFVGGALAGITAASVTYPLDLVRTRLAAQTNVVYYRGIWHTLQTISKEEGILGLYKGLGATLLGVGPSIAISFSVYEGLRSFWQQHRPQDSQIPVSLACGSFSGIAAATATFPLDLVRRRKQLEGAGGQARVYKTGLFGTFKHIIKSEGFRGLYRGILPEYYKVVPGVGICFMTYEKLKTLLADTGL